MDKQVDVLTRTLELSETTLEGLEHIYSMTMQGALESTAKLYTEVADSFYEMQKALIAHWAEYQGSELEQGTEKVIRAMRYLLLAYEGDREVRPMEILQLSLLPAYRRWCELLGEALAEDCSRARH